MFRCENGENGCRMRIQRRQMKEHVEKCEWKPGDITNKLSNINYNNLANINHNNLSNINYKNLNYEFVSFSLILIYTFYSFSVDCPVPACRVKLPRTKVLIHLQTHHLSVFAGGRLDSRTSLFIAFFLLSLLLNLIFFWQFSQSDI